MNRIQFGVLALVSSAATLCAGCRSDDVYPPDSGARRDSGPRDATAGPGDAALGDTGTSTTTSSDGGTPEAGRGDAGRMDASGTDGGTGFVTTTVQNASRLINRNVQINDAVVVAEHHATIMGGVRATFYIQDQGTAGRGLAVFKNNTDSTLVPAVGDKVTVKGHLSRFSGSLQVQSQRASGIALEVTAGGTGTVMGGALAPAGTPINGGDVADYSYETPETDNHPDEIGNVIKFDGPLEAVPAPDFVVTNADGGLVPQGFEVVGGLWVSNTHVRIDCLRGMDGGLPNLENGIRGVWDRHQNFNGDSGTPGMRPGLIGVLFPTSCKDLTSP